MNRRRLLTAVAGTSTGLGFAGCLGSSESDETTEPSQNESETEAVTAQTDETLEDFEDLSVWSATGGSLSADSEHVIVGSQSARFEIDRETESSSLSYSFDSPIDLSAVIPGIGFRSMEGQMANPWLRLTDSRGNQFDFRRSLQGDLPLMRLNFGIDEFDPAFDMTQVTDVTLVIWSGEEALTVWFDDLHTVPRPETGKVMIQFDDAHVTDYTEALPILEEYDYPAVTFVNPGYIEEADEGHERGGFPRLTTEQTHALSDAGWMIANHTWSHAQLDDLDRDGQREEIERGKEWLLEEGFAEGAEYFAYPFGGYNTTTLELAAEYHKLNYAGGYPIQGYTVNDRLASRISEPDAERARRVLETTAEKRGITSIFYHRLENQLLEDFEAMVSILHELESAGELEVILPSDVERELVV